MNDVQMPEYQAPLTNPNPAAARSVICGAIAMGILLTCFIPQIVLGALFLSPTLGLVAILYGIAGVRKGTALGDEPSRGKSKLGIAMGVLALLGSATTWALAAVVARAISQL